MNKLLEFLQPDQNGPFRFDVMDHGAIVDSFRTLDDALYHIYELYLEDDHYLETFKIVDKHTGLVLYPVNSNHGERIRSLKRMFRK